MKMNEKEMIQLFIDEFSFDKVEQFIEHNGINSLDRDKRTLLYTAISEKNEDLARYLVQKGCLINLQDKDGFTPLHFAVIYNLYDIANLLIEKGADINLKDRWGNTALLRSVTGNHKGETAITKLLLKHGASLDDKNNGGVSARDFIES
ncbi:ankyrin repeat domain-containing protein [Aggregatibacter actinomycetemcomitans]|uniref:ankyrin repeat domain-containing protein n=1 Tax=Aggregatibacter actinomycetemcomitans TaxID=714 RepID=UPI00197B35F8|nr:ankyrin repeat domain-containing protein [Aggregatibacter actinomycetemcomitans]MBN6073712.1 ankyrin repeat domain-containing protein [Aggregatibacter actinomycetemcomitans]